MTALALALFAPLLHARRPQSNSYEHSVRSRNWFCRVVPGALPGGGVLHR